MPRKKKVINEKVINEKELNNINLENNKNLTNTESLTNSDHLDLITWNDFKKKEKMYYEVINDFFKKCSNEDITLMNEIINGSNIISLRFLDWFVTRYCYLYKTSINVNNNYYKEKDFNININISYKAQLKSFKKKYFDPFRRKKKFIYTFVMDEFNLLTTLGQLNFFKWALSFDIIKYVQNNFDSINNKISHVNSYFKKNTIETNSYTLTTSEEQNSLTHSDSKNNTDKSYQDKNSQISYDLSSNDVSNILTQKDINLLMNINDKEQNIDSNLMILNRKKQKKIYSDMKKLSKQNNYNPVVSRNICIEL